MKTRREHDPIVMRGKQKVPPPLVQATNQIVAFINNSHWAALGSDAEKDTDARLYFPVKLLEFRTL